MRCKDYTISQLSSGKSSKNYQSSKLRFLFAKDILMASYCKSMEIFSRFFSC